MEFKLTLAVWLTFALAMVAKNLQWSGSSNSSFHATTRSDLLLVSPQKYVPRTIAQEDERVQISPPSIESKPIIRISKAHNEKNTTRDNLGVQEELPSSHRHKPDLLRKPIILNPPNTTSTALSTQSDDPLLSLPPKWARAFPIWSTNRSKSFYSWCHKEGGRATQKSGILFVKVNKCASSTGMGVTLRIADTMGHRILNSYTNGIGCFARYRHGFASTDDRQYGSRRRDTSVLWTMLRHPAPRVLSAYFFYQVSRRNQDATEEALLAYVQDKQFQTHYVNYLRLKKVQSASREQEIEHIMANYDFIGVSERMDESLVVLSMLLLIPIADIVVLPSKQSGGYDDGRSKKGCVKLKSKWSTPKIDEYLYGDFLKGNWDYLLYQAANVSLDRTIDALGRDRVAEGVRLYQHLSQQNEVECRSKATFPCPTPPGLKNAYFHTVRAQQSCYFEDAGCGHKCTDAALQTASSDGWKQIQEDRNSNLKLKKK